MHAGGIIEIGFQEGEDLRLVVGRKRLLGIGAFDKGRPQIRGRRAAARSAPVRLFPGPLRPRARYPSGARIDLDAVRGPYLAAVRGLFERALAGRREAALLDVG